MKNIYMIKTILLLITAFSISNITLGQGFTCCPEFYIVSDGQICPDSAKCQVADPEPDPKNSIIVEAACKESSHTYTVYPNEQALYSYNWTVTGGAFSTGNSTTDNPCVVQWGNGTRGTLTVVISGNGCLDTLSMDICLVDRPYAGFTVTPGLTICAGGILSFSNSTINATDYLWDFGDGHYSTDENPSHQYSASGKYTVLLTAYDNSRTTSTDADFPTSCGCRDTVSIVVNVEDGIAPEIRHVCFCNDTIVDCQEGTICPGDTSYVYTSTICNPYIWNVTGGTIIDGDGTECIAIKWDHTIPSNTTTSVTLSDCNNGNCPGTVSILIPVMHNQLQITGSQTACQNTPVTFSLPTLPGAIYNWSVSGPAVLQNISIPDKNNETYTEIFPDCGEYKVQCVYHHPRLKCRGISSYNINIRPTLQIKGKAEVCMDETVYYSTQGTCLNNNPSADANWEIIPPGAGTINPSSTGQLVKITWNTPGNHIVQATAINQGDFCEPTATINVEVHPKPIITNITGYKNRLCPERNYTYTVESDTDDGEFNWTISGGHVINQFGPLGNSVVVIWDQNYSMTRELNVTQKNQYGCESDPFTISVTLADTPTISGDNMVCSDTEHTYKIPSGCQLTGIEWYITNSNGTSNVGTIVSGQGTQEVTILWNWDNTIQDATLHVKTCNGMDEFDIHINQNPPLHFLGPKYVTYCSSAIAPNSTHTINILAPTPPTTPQELMHSYSGSSFAPVSSALCNSSTAPFVLNLYEIKNQIGLHSFYVNVGDDCPGHTSIIYVEILECISGGGVGTGQTCDVNPEFIVKDCSGELISNTSTGNIISYLWQVSPIGHSGSGSYSNPNDADPQTLSVTQSGDYKITLTVTGSNNCTRSAYQIISVLLTPVLNIPSEACTGEPVPLDVINYSNMNYSYHWDFDDGITSNLKTLYHAWNTSGTFKINFTVSNGNCSQTVSADIIIHDISPCKITLDPDTIICPNTTAHINVCPGMQSYSLYKDSTEIMPPTTAPDFNISPTGYYYVGYLTQEGCASTSSEVFLYEYQLPVARISGDKYIDCVNHNYNYSFYMKTPVYSHYDYTWSILDPNPTSITINSPDAALTYFNVPTNEWTNTGNSFLEILIEVLVTDTKTGCTNRDTTCMLLYKAPRITINSIVPDMCSGEEHTLSIDSSIPSTGLEFLWNNGATGPTMTTAHPGVYIVTGTDPVTGCSSSAFAGEIHELPDLSLFPTGCDTICVNEQLDIFLPLPNDQNYQSIEWFANGDYSTTVGNGNTLNFASSTPGEYQLSVIVCNYHCCDTAGVHCVHVIPCMDCDCEDSGWSTDPTIRWIIPSPGFPPTYEEIVLPCNSGETIDLECYKAYGIMAEYSCTDSTCSNTEHIITLPDNSVINGSSNSQNIIAFTADLEGYYHYAAYGYCGDILCDSCVSSFYVKECDPPDCCEDKDILADPQVEHIEKESHKIYAGIKDIITVNYANVKSIRASIVNLEIVGFNYPDCQRCQIDESMAGIFEKGGVNPIGALQYNTGKPQGNREIIWGDGNEDMSSGSPASYRIILPATWDIECCEAEYKVCIKYVITDVDCNVCDTTICINIPTGDTSLGNCDCNCEKNDVKINGDSYHFEAGDVLEFEYNHTYDFSTSCLCLPEEKCKCSAQWVFTNQSANNAQSILIDGVDISFTFDEPGLYKIECIVKCDGNNQCKPSKCITAFEAEAIK